MIWVTWRQARAELLLGLVVLAAIVTFYVWTGLDSTSSYHDSILPACVASHAGTDDCWTTASDFLSRFGHLTDYVSWLNFLPLFLGMLLAAPAVLELESGTYRMAWTQGVTRGRWLLAKLGLGIAVAAIVSAALVVMWSWWRGPFDALQGRFDGNAFDFEGTAPIAYTVFAFALCVTAGTLLRRTIPAVGISFVAFLAIRLGIENKLRPHYRAPVSVTWDPTAQPPAAALSKFGDGDWVLHQGLASAPGHIVPFGDQALRACLGSPIPAPDGASPAKVAVAAVDQGSINTCLHDAGLLNTLVYQPAHRFWLFQGIETAIFLGLAALLLGLTIWWVQRRIA
jgi:hypothetical protein